MKTTGVLITVAIGVVLQLALARYTVGGRWVFDLVLVGIVYAALTWGAGAGTLAGTLGGLVQDVLSNSIVGTGGLIGTLVGFATGAMSAKFIVARPVARVALLAGATVLHRILLVLLRALIEQHAPAVPWGAILGETLVNSFFGFIVFQINETVPMVVSRSRQDQWVGTRRRDW